MALAGFGAVLVGAAVFAALRSGSAAETSARGGAGTDARSGEASLPAQDPSVEIIDGIGSEASPRSSSNAAPPRATDPATIRWTVPRAWAPAANPNAMRIATYRPARAPGDLEDGDISITRAGGTIDANIERWFAQFKARGDGSRSEKDVRGRRVTLVEIGGTYLGTGMTPEVSTNRPGWALLGAIVEAPGAPYFVKIVGPAATVRLASGPLNELLESIVGI